MPRTTNENKDNLKKEIIEKTSKKSSSVSEKSNSKKSTSQKDTKKKGVEKKSLFSKKAEKKSSIKDNSSTTTKETKKKQTEKKSLFAKKEKVSKEKKISSKATIAKPLTKALLTEYYDLPYRYNQTTVKMLAQTPTKLFIYWEISDEDRNSFKEKYGEDFFNVSKPVLIVHNLTMNYSFEVEINDFANSWYVDINHANCYYDIELGRRPIMSNNNKIKDSYIYISSSNSLQSPNNHILFENINPNTVFNFKNVKTKTVSTKKLSNTPFFKAQNRIYNIPNIYELYKHFYSENLLKEFANTKLNNPSSGSISSFK